MLRLGSLRRGIPPSDETLANLSQYSSVWISQVSRKKQTASHSVLTDVDGFSLIRYENDAEQGGRTYYFPYLKLWQNLIRRSQACLGLNTDVCKRNYKGDIQFWSPLCRHYLHPKWTLANFPLYLRARVRITKYYIKGNGRLGWLHQLTPDPRPEKQNTELNFQLEANENFHVNSKLPSGNLRSS